LVSEHLSHSQIFLLLFVSSLGPVLMLFGFAVIGEYNKPVVVKRRTKSTNLGEYPSARITTNFCVFLCRFCFVSFFFSSSLFNRRYWMIDSMFAADDERTTRRESYLKATEGGRMHFDSEMSDGDVSPQVLRR
jgi:hypothetical protein